MRDIFVTPEQAQSIVDKHHSQQASVQSLQEFKYHGPSVFTTTKSYKITLSDGASYVLKASPTDIPATPAHYAPNNLSAEYGLLQVLFKRGDIPQPSAYILDTSQGLVPFAYLLLSSPPGIPLSEARASGKLTERQSLLLDLRIGSLLKTIHQEVQNDWFGLPSQEADELYSWQEAFAWLLESLLDEAQECKIKLAYEDLRRYLSRAIGFFLFDDCEVPSLVTFLADEDTILVEFDSANPPEGDEIRVTSLGPLSHALWGDPLLEKAFVDPSAAMIEGYGGSPVVFARHRTKRTWYTLFMALTVVVQSKREEGMKGEDAEKVKQLKWAQETLQKCVEALKDAPCY